MKKTVTFCRICEASCGLTATVDRGRVIKLESDPEHPISRGFACPKGLAMHEVTHDQRRILHPLRKKADGSFEQISWETAISEVAERLTDVRAKHGKQSSGFYLGNPIAFSYASVLNAKGFVDAMDGQFYTSASQDTVSRFAASALLYGSPLIVPVPDIHFTDLLIVVGANPVVSHGSLIAGTTMHKAMHDIVERGGRVVVVDPRRTETARLYEHIAVKPDGDAWLFLAILHVIFRKRLDNPGKAEEQSVGLSKLRDLVEPITPELATEYCGIDAQQIEQLACDIATAKSATIYGRVGACTGRFSTLVNFLMDAVNIVTGNLDSRGGSIFPSPPLDLLKPMIDRGLDTYGAKRSRIGNAPDVLGILPGAVMADEMLTPGEGQIKSMFIIAGNPVASIPGSKRLEEGFKQLDLLVSMDFNFNDTNRHADYILPSTTFLERADINAFTLSYQVLPNLQWTDPVIPPLGEAREEWEIIRDICAEMNTVPSSFGPLRAIGWLGRKITPKFMFDAMLRMGKYGDKFGFKSSGWSLKKLRKRHPHGVNFSDRMPTGVMKSRLTHDDNKLHLCPPEIVAEVQNLRGYTRACDFPLRMFGRRELRAVNSWMKNSPLLRTGEMGPTCALHPDDAKLYGVQSGELARISSRSGAIEARVEVSEDIMPGSVCIPHGWSAESCKELGARSEHFNVNELANAGANELDELSGSAILNGVDVKIEAGASF